MTATELRAARDRLGLTQRELAEAIGKHVNTIARYERGELEIPRVVALAVAGL